MNVWGRIVITLILPTMLLVGCGAGQGRTSALDSIVLPSQTDEPRSAQQEVADMVTAANAFIDLLAPDQKEVALLPVDSDKRPNWSNLPARIVKFDRNGVRVGDLRDEQLAAMITFLAYALSPDGFDTVVTVMAADGVLADSWRAWLEGWSEDNYWLAFFGTPSVTEPWGWQFGGHHLAVNMSIQDGGVTMSPTFIGVEPATVDQSVIDRIFPISGGGVGDPEPFSREIEAGLSLINSLASPDRTAAILSGSPDGLVSGVGQDGVIPALEGSEVSGWDPDQKQALLDLVSLWVGMMPSRSAEFRLAQIGSQLNDTYFAWQGPSDGTGSIYYRIQGPSLIVEFSTQGAVGSDGGHYHSIYRDPTNEYGQR